MRSDLFLCQCSSSEHQIIFRWFENDLDDRYVYADIHLVPEYNIFKRIWYAIKYIFGYKSKYGAFEEFIFNPKDADKLQKIVDYLKNVQPDTKAD